MCNGNKNYETYFLFQFLTVLPLSLLAGVGRFLLHISGGWKYVHLHGVLVAFTFGYTLHFGEMRGPPHKKQTIPGPVNCNCLLFAILSSVIALVCFPCFCSLNWTFLMCFLFDFWLLLLLLLSCFFLLLSLFSNSLKLCSLMGLAFAYGLPLLSCFFFTWKAWHSCTSLQTSILFKEISDFSSLSNVMYIWKSSDGEYLLPVASSRCFKACYCSL